MLKFSGTQILAWLRQKWWIPTLVLCLLVFIGISQREQPLEVELTQVETGLVEQFLSEEAKTRLDRDYILTLPVAGYVPRLNIVVGDWVQQTQEVVRLRPYERQQQLAGLQAQIAEVNARKQGIQSQLPAPEDDQQALLKIQDTQQQIEQSKRQLRVQELELEQRQRTYERHQQLFKEHVITQAEFEDTAKQVQVLQEQVKQQRIQLERHQQEIASSQLHLAKIQRNRRDQQYLKQVYQSQANQIASQVALKQDELQQSILRAPISGPVLEVFQAQAGLQAAGTQILKLGDLSSLMVEADILSEDIPLIKVGQMTEISGKALGSKTAKGQVYRIYPQGFTKLSALGVEQQRVKILVKSTGLKLLPGTRVDLKVITDARPRALRIPERALFKQAGQWHVFKVDSQNRSQLQKVTLGLQNQDWVEVTQGLKAGEKVISQLENSLKPGMLLKAKATTKP